MKDKYSKENIKKITQAPSPRVLLNICTHGSERVGLKVAKYFNNLKIVHGTFLINVANEKAAQAGKRFISHDLNGVFSGKINGSYEENLAHEMKPFIEAFDVVLDIHSTETGVGSSLIITKFTSIIKPIIWAISPKRVLYMNIKKSASSSLISCAKIGVAFEYGKDKNTKTYLDTIKGIKNLLEHYKMIESCRNKEDKGEIDFYEITSVVVKPDGFKVSPKIKNFSLLKKGSVIGHNPETKKDIISKKDFYPILFGKNSYKSMFGFSANKKIKKI